MELTPNRSTQPHTHPSTTIPPDLVLASPGLLPAAAFLVSPGAGVKAGRRPPSRAWP
jgi:hypothetical protein